MPPAPRALSSRFDGKNEPPPALSPTSSPKDRGGGRGSSPSGGSRKDRLDRVFRLPSYFNKAGAAALVKVLSQLFSLRGGAFLRDCIIAADASSCIAPVLPRPLATFSPIALLGVLSSGARPVEAVGQRPEGRGSTARGARRRLPAAPRPREPTRAAHEPTAAPDRRVRRHGNSSPCKITTER